ncbi:MAG: ATP-binding protein [Chthoniobacterales bacterium]
MRAKIALSAGALAACVVLLFAAFSAYWFYKEQLDFVSDEKSHLASREQMAEAWEETSELMVAYLVALPFAAVLSAAGAWWVAARLTRPLLGLAKAAQKIDARSLDARLPEPAGGDEIFTLARALNQLLDRLERSFQQSTRFSADASHELRTPLTVMRAQLEQAIKDHPRGDQTAVLVELLEENQRLSSVAEKLLLLTRADAGRLLPGMVAVDLSSLLADVVNDYAIMTNERSVSLAGELQPGICVRGDEGLLRQLLFNFFDNALTHNVEGGWIRYGLLLSPEGVKFTIANSGPPIPESSRRMLFDRFFRIDESRDRSGGGAGLGLSLCREIAHAHGGSVSLSRALADENEFLLVLPLADAAG